MYTATRVPPGSFIVALHLGNIAAPMRVTGVNRVWEIQPDDLRGVAGLG
jgi:hypothetical protein